MPNSRRWVAALGAVTLVTSLLPAAAQAQTAAAPAPPRTYLNTSPVSPTGRTITVNAGGNLQSALDSAVPGDVIVLQAGARFTGNFRLRNKAGSGWITIRSSAAGQLPGPGSRVSPSHASLMPKIVTANNQPAIMSDRGAHHYRFIGIEFGIQSGVGHNYNIIQLGQDGDTSVSQLPHNIVFDRVYVHGNTTGNARRGILLNAVSSAVVDSYISEIHEVGADSQAILITNSPGPFKIVNNYLEAAGENVLIGGSDPTISNLVPSDVEVRRNLFSKPRRWRQGDSSFAGTAWTVKNIFELKNAQRVLIDGNVFEYNWPHAQNGYSILFTVRNQDGTAPWSVVQDITFTNNIVRHVSSGINILGSDDIRPSQPTRRIRIANNLFVDVNGGNWGGFGRWIQLLAGTSDVAVVHNTVFQSNEVVVASGAATTNFEFRDNLVNGRAGFGGDGTYGNTNMTLSTYFRNHTVTRNCFVSGNSGNTPSGNYFPASFDQVGFVSMSGGDYRLAAGSEYKNAGSDGKDIGADINAISGALGASAPPPSGGTDGGWSGGGTSGGDTIAPIVSVTAPAGGQVSGTVTLTANATDNVGVAGVRFLVDGAQVGGELTGAPYSISWNTAAVSDGAHVITAVARDLAGNSATSAGVSVTVANGLSGGGTSPLPPPPPASGAASPVVWQRVRNLAVSGSSLQKNAGCDGCQDAGASSAQSIASAGGYFEFTAPDTSTQRVVGLSNGDDDLSERDIEFGLKLWPGGVADVRLNGAYQHVEVPFRAGDVFRVHVESDTSIAFLKNGAVFHRARGRVRFPLVADTSFTSMNGRVTNAVMSGSAPGAATPGSSTGVGGPITWVQRMNLDLVGTALTKVGGCDGCQDAGAVSSAAIPLGGSGYVEFTTTETSGLRVIGLSVGNSDTSEADVDFGLKFWPGGGVDVRENGAYVGAETRYQVGDRWRIAVDRGVVSYYRNGTLFYRSARPAAGPLLVDTAFFSSGTQLSDVTLSGAQ